MSSHVIWRLTEDDAPAAGALLARAFADDPTFSYALPDVTPNERVEGIRPFFVVAVRYGCRYGEAWAIGRRPPTLEGVAWWIPMPEAAFSEARGAAVGTTSLPAGIHAALDRVLEWESASDAALARVVPQQHRLLQQLGVEPACQGYGLGRGLLAKLLDDAEAAGVPLGLATASPANVAFCQRAGMMLVAAGDANGTCPAWWAFAAGLGAEVSGDR